MKVGNVDEVQKPNQRAAADDTYRLMMRVNSSQN